ncbi:MAG: hypothetical protein Q8Q37_02740 [bacterium]|nr:hypothetical protein [bacterium]
MLVVEAGLRAEERCLQAILSLQTAHQAFRGWSIVRAARTYRHASKKISRLDAKKVDIVVVFEKRSLRRPKIMRRVFVLQIKSTDRSYETFLRNSKFSRNTLCLLVKISYSDKRVVRDVKKIFYWVLKDRKSRRPFFRHKIRVDLL